MANDRVVNRIPLSFYIAFLDGIDEWDEGRGLKKALKKQSARGERSIRS